MIHIAPVTLEGPHARLEPLGSQHHDDLVDAVRDGELWNLWYTFIPTPERMQAEIERRLQLQAQGSMLPFAVIHPASGRAVGMTTYMNIDSAHHRVEIGSTWYRRSVQRSALNTQCKRLLLSQAFDTLGCNAVEFRTHWFNHDSRNAIERLGAKLDGVLRAHQIAPNGSLRDTVVYSIVASEWPAVRSHLDYQLSRPRPTL
jgi:RimJ/RimL family protein N-acetyltransferase